VFVLTAGAFLMTASYVGGVLLVANAPPLARRIVDGSDVAATLGATRGYDGLSLCRSASAACSPTPAV